MLVLVQNSSLLLIFQISFPFFPPPYLVDDIIFPQCNWYAAGHFPSRV